MTSIYPHQRAAFSELLRTAKTYFSGVWIALPIQPRFNRLLVAESGSGKSFLGRALATELGIPIWDVTCTNWIPIGCSERGARPSWLDVVDFVGTHENCVILLDELDKLGTETTPWMTCVRTEIFGLLDRQIPINLLVKTESWEEDEKPELSVVRSKLGHSVFIVGAGAFQQLWQSDSQETIGFGGGSNPSPEKMNLHRLTQVVSVELINRFAPPVLALPPLSEADYQQLLDTTLQQLDGAHRKIARAVGQRAMAAAIRDRLGVRYVEQIMLGTASEIADRMAVKAGKHYKRKSSELLAETDLLTDLSEPL
jgi:SpoVK/Ycf46/Vps4 family AAA+-type ATPase